MSADQDDYAKLLEFLYVVPVGLIRTDRDGMIRNMNPTANSVLAVLASGAPPGNAFDALAPAVGDLRKTLRQNSSGTLTENLDFVVPGKAQRTLSLSVHAVGESELAFILADVTERVRQRRQILRQEMELRSIFETVHNHMIVLLDSQLNIQEFNASIGRLTGFGEDVVGENLASLFSEQVDLEAVISRAEKSGWADIAASMASRKRAPWWGESVLSRIPDAQSKTVGFAMVTREDTARRERELKLEKQAFVDPLTGLPNRRRYEQVFTTEISRARRHETSIALLLLDIDHFKQVNDRHGHPVGDDILEMLSSRLAGVIREGDLLARMGGEEFGILAPETGQEAAMAFAQRCRDAIVGSPFQIDAIGEALSITVSIGVASLDDRRDTQELMYQAADEALYRAKEKGRNRVEAA